MSELVDISTNPDTIIVKIDCEPISLCWTCFPISKKYWSFSVCSDVDIQESKKWYCNECEDYFAEKILWIKVKIFRSDLETVKEEFKNSGYELTHKKRLNVDELVLECDETLE